VITAKVKEFFEQTQVIGHTDNSITRILYGINNNNIPIYTKPSKDMQGYVFITRPQLNLSTDNIRNVRIFYDMLNTGNLNTFGYVRNVLDPRCESKSLLVDNSNPFISVVSNTVTSVTGWPDSVLPTYSSAMGNKKQQWSIGDGIVDLYSSFDLDMTLKNFAGDPLLYLFQTWIYYIQYVFEGVIYPYPDFIVENEIDYNTRIYRIIMDRDNKTVKRIYATGASFPISIPNGKLADYNKDTVYSKNTNELNIRFKCDGGIYGDPILLDNFNKTVEIFSPDITKNKKKMTDDKKLYNGFKAIPYINKKTLELEWYI